MHTDTYELERFVRAQDGVYEQALTEITHGRKRSHWMWFIFPQFAGLAMSPTSQHFAISSLGEARAYLAHPTLGPRLQQCATALLSVESRTAHEIFGFPDDMKLRSSATLFAAATSSGSVFQALLEQYFGGAADERTLQLIAEAAAREP